MKCVLCEEEVHGFGNHASPLAEGSCCDNCNVKVIKERLRIAAEHHTQTKL